MPFHLEEGLRELTESFDTAVGSTDGTPESEKEIMAKVYSPTMNWTWTIYEAEQVEMDDLLFFGRVDGFESELGYFTLSELQTEGAFCQILTAQDEHFLEMDA
mgnify:CR=1 FL=1